jgi:hypothetical protein
MAQKRNKHRLFVLTGSIVAIGLIAFAGLAILRKAPTKQNTASQPLFNTISDTPHGLSFNISKSFAAIPDKELASLNPGFLYGYRPSGDANTECVISQTEAVNITAGPLRDGIFNEIKNNHTDASLDSSANAQIGAVRGVSLQMSFTDGGLHIKRIEIAAVGNTKMTFAYCQSLATDSSKYYNDFTIFFSSLKLTK